MAPRGSSKHRPVFHGIVLAIGFIVGGAFVASALNDVTWLTFAMMASLDRLAHQPVSLPVLAPASGHRAAADTSGMRAAPRRR